MRVTALSDVVLQAKFAALTGVLGSLKVSGAVEQLHWQVRNVCQLSMIYRSASKGVFDYAKNC